MKPEDVAQYLQDNPQFFENYADVIANINIPHPHNKRVIPISERQIATLRDQNRTLQNKLLELISFGEKNDAIGEKMHRLSIALLSCSSTNELLHKTKFHLCEDFSIPHIAIRLWDIFHDKNNDIERIEFTATTEDIHAIAESLSQPYCGSHIADEIKNWFGDDAVHLQSFSMTPLRTKKTIGLLVLASPEPQRFFPEMETLHLKRLGELISTALTSYAC